MAPTDVDNALRGIMAAAKRYALDVGGGPAAVGGSANAITITTNQVISTGHQAAGFSVRFKAGNTNTGATTAAVDGLTAVAVKRLNGDDLSAGDIVSGGIYDLAHNGTNYTLMQGVNLSNFPTLSANNAFTGTNTFSTSPRPSANDAAALGVSGTAWADLFLASGAVINFNAGDIRLTHSSEVLTFAGADSGYQFVDGPIRPVNNGGVNLGTAAAAFANLYLTTAIELGHASDTTLSRSGAGVLAVEGVAIEPGANRASFSADKNAVNQSISSGSAVKLTFTNEIFDVGSYYTSSAWTPPAGSCSIVAGALATGLTAAASFAINIYKNGSPYKAISVTASSAGNVAAVVTAIDQCNGTDFYEVYVGSGTYTVNGSTATTFFQGTLI